MDKKQPEFEDLIKAKRENVFMQLSELCFGNCVEDMSSHQLLPLERTCIANCTMKNMVI